MDEIEVDSLCMCKIHGRLIAVCRCGRRKRRGRRSGVEPAAYSAIGHCIGVFSGRQAPETAPDTGGVHRVHCRHPPPAPAQPDRPVHDSKALHRQQSSAWDM